MSAPDHQMEELAMLLNYDPVTGHFTWIVDLGGKASGVGGLAGGLDANGYLVITYKGKRHKGHRLAWYMMFGWCPELLDHRNGQKADNRIRNLRPADELSNSRNRKEHRAGKPLGVSFRKDNGMWVAQYWKRKKKVYLGQFESAEAAHQAYKEATA